MEDNNIVSLFGSPIPEKEEGEIVITSEEVLDRCKNEGNFESVVVIGVTEDGNIGFSTNYYTKAEVLLLIEQMKLGMLSS